MVFILRALCISPLSLPLFALLFLIEKSECADFSFDFACLARKIPCKSKNLKSRDDARKMKIPILIKNHMQTLIPLCHSKKKDMK